MAKLTLFFNNKPIEVFQLKKTTSTIGRDSSNTFVVDSLAIAPSQFKISYIADEHVIESLSEQFPTRVNDEKITRQSIRQSDKIQIGKHTLTYSQSAEQTSLENIQETSTNNLPKQVTGGNLQVTSGANIGLVINLSSAVTEVKIAGIVAAIVAKRHNGYFISPLADNIEILINGTAISNDTKLEDNAKVRVDKNNYLFFFE